jgi:hypothetical protein
MDFKITTRSYEEWLEKQTPLLKSELELKHRKMADPANPFPFFRGTYYRWIQHWSTLDKSFKSGPIVLSVGDLHLENFGTWRDLEGRLCWGVNDFDEIDDLPYTHDLIRLAASAYFAKVANVLELPLKDCAEAIEEGYRKVIEAKGKPFVLEEQNKNLRQIAMTEERNPQAFWNKETACLTQPPADVPNEARQLLLATLPEGSEPPEFRYRLGAGMGSLGKPRIIALTRQSGSWVAREAKKIVPPATFWLDQKPTIPSRIGEVVSRAVRCADPFYRPSKEWVIRRLAPRSSKIEIDHLAKSDDVVRLMQAMGGETANIHLGTPRSQESILADLTQKPKRWLQQAAQEMSALMENDWKSWQTE